MYEFAESWTVITSTVRGDKDHRGTRMPRVAGTLSRSDRPRRNSSERQPVLQG